MFWIGLIVGIFVLALIEFTVFMSCLTIAEVNFSDLANLLKAGAEAIGTRDSRIEVYYADTNEKLFEAEFKFPWDDED